MSTCVREADPIHVCAERAVGVRHDDEREPVRPKREERGPHAVGNELPEIVRLMVGMELDQGRRGLRRLGNAGVFEDEVEEQPPSARVSGRADRPLVVELFAGARLRARELVGSDVYIVVGKRRFDPCPVREEENAAGIEEDSLEHGVLYRHQS